MGHYEKLLRELSIFAQENRVPIIGQAGGNLLVDIVKTHQPRRVLEIGTAIGYSTLLIKANMPQDGEIVTIEQSVERLAIANQIFLKAQVEDQIKIIQGDASQVLTQLQGTFDLVFIDAAKGQYLDYLKKVIPHLSVGAVVVADNVLFRGWVLGEEMAPKRFRTIVKRLKEYIRFIEIDYRFESRVCKEGDGMAISYYQGEKNFEKA